RQRALRPNCKRRTFNLPHSYSLEINEPLGLNRADDSPQDRTAGRTDESICALVRTHLEQPPPLRLGPTTPRGHDWESERRNAEYAGVYPELARLREAARPAARRHRTEQ